MSEAPKLEETVVQDIFLPVYPGAILYTGNIWPDNPERSEKEFDRLREYNVVKGLVNEGVQLITDSKVIADGDTVKKSEVHSRLARLCNLATGFGETGLTVVDGFAGKILTEDEIKQFEEAVRILKNYEKNESIIWRYARRILETPERANGDSELLKQARMYCDLEEKAILLAGKRHDELDKTAILASDHVLAIRGVGDRGRDSWPKLRQDGIFPYNIGNRVLNIAYLGGYNYGPEHRRDLPHLIANQQRLTSESIDYFLRSKEFDILVFSGSYDILAKAVDKVNKEVSVKKRFWSASEPKLQNKLFIVSDPDVKEHKIDYGTSGKNLFVQGINYKDDKMLLIDPQGKHLRLAVIGSTDLHSSGKLLWDYAFKVVEAYDYIDGNKKILTNFERREEAGAITSAMHAISNVVHNEDVKKKAKSFVGIALRYGLAATLGAAAGVFGASLMSEGEGLDNVVRKLQEDVEKRNHAVEAQKRTIQEQGKIITNYEELFRKHIEEQSK